MVNQVTNLGAGGLGPWFIQRVSAVILAAFIAFLAVYFFSHTTVSYEAWTGLFAGMGMKMFTLAALLSLLSHAWIGVWTVATDYIHCHAIRLVFMCLVIAGLFASLIWGIQLLWSV